LPKIVVVCALLGNQNQAYGSAVVITKYKDGYVLAGKSLREVEDRERRLEIMVGLGWLFTLGSTFIATLFLKFLSGGKKS